MDLFHYNRLQRRRLFMRLLRVATIVALVAGAAACVQVETAPEMDPIAAAVSGRMLVAGDNVLLAGSDGSLTGTLANGAELTGAWEVRDGQWCRTLVTPENLAGTDCQAAELGDGTITIEGTNGPTTWTIQ
jgi:hypothetical protein